MKKILALSAILALFTGCTELNLPQTQAQTQKAASDDEWCDLECQVKEQERMVKERREYEIRTFGN